MEKLYMTFDVDGIPYEVIANPCKFNEELRYEVSVNNGENIIFAFDKELGRYAAAGNNSIDVPDYVGMEIGNELNRDSLANTKTTNPH